jgi:hypothetical protein
MRAHALYFPFINVPNSRWFSRVLLYWESVSAIVPFDFVRNPELLSTHMRDLVRVGLVRQIIPGDYVPQVSEGRDTFNEYLEQLGAKIESRREAFANRKFAQVHIEKMHYGLIDDLQRLALAGPDEQGWLPVETKTANDYMAFLAATIGQCAEEPLAPITDGKEGLSPFACDEDKDDQSLDDLRLDLLAEAFPAPRRRVGIQDLDNFKQRHGDKLASFRIWLETELTDTAAITDPRLRKRRFDLVKTRIREDTGRIRETMETHGWVDPICGDFCAVLGAVNKGAKLVNAVYKATHHHGQASTSPMAYAAYAQEALGLGKDDGDQ